MTFGIRSRVPTEGLKRAEGCIPTLQSNVPAFSSMLLVVNNDSALAETHVRNPSTEGFTKAGTRSG